MMSRWLMGLLILLGVYKLADGIARLFAPAYWYGAVPGVPETGPLNAHLVADSGTFLIPIGLALLIAARDPARYWLAIAIAAGADILHSALHVWSHAAGLLPARDLATEAWGIYVPTAILTVIAMIAARNSFASREVASASPRLRVSES